MQVCSLFLKERMWNTVGFSGRSAAEVDNSINFPPPIRTRIGLLLIEIHRRFSRIFGEKKDKNISGIEGEEDDR